MPLWLCLGFMVQVSALLELGSFGSFSRKISISDQTAKLLSCSLGIVSAILGSPIGETGNLLLKQSLQLLDRVQSRVDPEPLSKHWSMLQLSILNNQACVLSDLSMHDQILDRLVKMGLTLTKASSVLDPCDQELFHWTVQQLIEEKFAAAA
jgi:hypothetical protein